MTSRPSVPAAERGRALFEARSSRRPIAPFTDVDPDLTQAQAYEIQGHFVDALLSEGGGEVVGYKLGLTSLPMQRMLGVDEPDYGPVLSSMVHTDGVEIPLDDFIAPKIEAEIGLVLDADLRGPGVTHDQARAAIRGASAALELVDSRIADWRINLADTIADLASSAAIVLSEQVVSIDGFDPRLVGMVVSRNGELVDTGAGAAALGDPVGAVAWLANTLATYDTTLAAGHVVMTGSLHTAFEPAAGDEVLAEFDRLGTVACRFV